MLKIGGSGHFDGEVNTRQLFVQEYITYLKSLKGPRIDVDTIRMDSTRGIFGRTKIFGDVQIKQNLEVSGDAIFKQSLLAQTIKVGDVLNNAEITLQTTSSGAKIINFGLSGPISPLPTTCIKPYASVIANFNPRLIITNGTAANSNVFDFTNDGSNGFIDYGFDINQYHVFDPSNPNTPRPALKLNSFCWGDVEIAKGGGFASTGNYFEVGNPVRNGNIASNILANNRIGQRITVKSPFPSNYTNPPALYNSQFFVNRDFIHAISVFNTDLNNIGDETFTVFGSGKTHIGIGRPKIGGVAENAMLTVDGLILAKEVRVAISTTTHWADYVFDKNYKLMTLKDVEHYIKQNNHLPNVPSTEEVKENGIDMFEISATLLRKIEELTLYTIELQKQLDEQKKIIDLIKK